MLLHLLLVASATICTLEKVPELEACRRCCTTGSVSACRFIPKCKLPEETIPSSESEQEVPEAQEKSNEKRRL